MRKFNHKKVVFKNPALNQYDENLYITNPEPVIGEEFTPDGIFSERIFGNSDYQQYSCKCGMLVGSSYQGITCATCNTVVAHLDHFNKFGIIDLKEVWIINPIFHSFLKKLLPLANILTKNILKKNGGGKYTAIGYVEFYEKFDEILEYAESLARNKDKKHIIELIRNNRDQVFTNKIFVLSTELRPKIGRASCRERV